MACLASERGAARWEVQELPPRALAMEMAAATDHFGPFLADLAERSLRGVESGPPRFAAEVRASELAEIIAATFHRSYTAC
jgi:hypothetical protein